MSDRLILLTVIGGLCQWVGIGLAAWALAPGRARAKQFRDAEAAAEDVPQGSSVGFAHFTGEGGLSGPKPNVEQRVDALEANLTEMRGHVRAAEERAGRLALQLAQQEARIARDRAGEDVRRTARFVLEITGVTWQAVTSLMLLVIGVGLQTGAGVASLCCL